MCTNECCNMDFPMVGINIEDYSYTYKVSIFIDILIDSGFESHSSSNKLIPIFQTNVDTINKDNLET